MEQKYESGDTTGLSEMIGMRDIFLVFKSQGGKKND